MTIATIRRVPVDLIIHSLAERFDPSKNDGAEEFTDNALSLGLYACIDSNGLAEEWAVSGGVAQTAEWMATVITDCDSWREPTAAETRVAEVAVCKRLLVTACNLCVTQDAEDHAAATALVQAASRILGVDVSRIIRTSADVEGYKDAMALQAAREQLQAALGRTPDAPPLTLRELINCLASKHTAAVADAIAKGKQVAAMQDQHTKVRAIFDDALGTTKGATTFTLTDIAEEMALQWAGYKAEAHATRVTLANVQGLLDKAERGRDDLRAERDRLRAQVDRMIAAMRESAPPVKTKPQPGDQVPWAEWRRAMREWTPASAPQPGDRVPWAEWRRAVREWTPASAKPPAPSSPRPRSGPL